MDGTYGNAFNSNVAMNPTSPSSGKYQTNVNRSKTRKWVEAKVQSYDGDDWGADYDNEDDAEEEPPIPQQQQQPQRPLGPRQHQPGGPPYRSYTPPQTQSQAPPTAHGATRTSAGVPPLRVQTRTASPPVSLLQQSCTPTAQGSQSASHVTRFPPRKSSMGQQDAADASNTPMSGSRPGSAQKTWAEPRSASPGSVKSPGAAPSKPLPFIRPSDIYKRMSEEQERERLPTESGRPSLDSLGRGGERPDTTPKSQMSSACTEKVESPRAQRLNLAPVAERKSEYGLDNLIASYGGDEDIQEHQPPDQAPQVLRQESLQNPVHPSLSVQNERQEPTEALRSQEVTVPERRFSTSPQLPNLGRMSGFGDDLFSPASFMSGGSGLSTVEDSTEPSKDSFEQPRTNPSEPLAEKTNLPGKTGEVNESEAAPLAPLNISALPATSPEPSKSVSRPSSRPSSAAGSPTKSGKVHNLIHTINSRSSSPTKEIMAPALPLKQEKARDLKSPPSISEHPAFRPSLPGDWVSETLTTPGEGAAPAQSERGNVPESNLMSHREPSDERRQTSTPSQAASPHSLPSLTTDSPVTSPSATVHASQVNPGVSSGMREVSTSPLQIPEASVDPEIVSPAPLNPRKGATPPELPQEISLPKHSLDRQSLERQYTMDTTASSPVKESDMLREEIMKSLSPAHPPRSFSEARSALDQPPTHPVAAPARESSYLPDLYDDYWASNDDKDQTVPVPAKPVEAAVKSATPPVPAVRVAPPLVSLEDDVSGARSGLGPAPEEAPRRFSWEGGPEQVNLADEPGPTGDQASDPVLVEPKSLGTETGGASAGMPMVSAPGLGPIDLLPSQRNTPPVQSALKSEGELGLGSSNVGLNYQVSEASTMATRSGSSPPAEPPLPVSMKSKPAAPADDRPSSPSGERAPTPPAIRSISPVPFTDKPMESGETTPVSPTKETTATPARAAPVNIVTFKQIMDMPTSADRTQRFQETRQQFAAIDTGLEDWMKTMHSKHSEYSNMSASFASAPTGVQTGGAPGAQPTPQAPYFQGNMPPPLHGTNTLGHTTAQVGTKGKKLFMAAGNAGKGLLSKGKSKLREKAGDKVFF